MMWIVPIQSVFLSTLDTKIDMTDWDGRTLEFPFAARVLGVTADAETNNGVHAEQYWDTMAAGDPLLIYQRDRDRYIGFGRLGTKTETTFFDEEYWHAGAHNVFTVEAYDDTLDVETDEINQLLGYESSFTPTGLSKVRTERPISDLLFYLDVARGPIAT